MKNAFHVMPAPAWVDDTLTRLGWPAAESGGVTLRETEDRRITEEVLDTPLLLDGVVVGGCTGAGRYLDAHVFRRLNFLSQVRAYLLLAYPQGRSVRGLGIVCRISRKDAATHAASLCRRGLVTRVGIGIYALQDPAQQGDRELWRRGR